MALSTRPTSTAASVLARNEEYSKIAVIKVFFYSSQKKNQLSVGGGILRGIFLSRAHQKFNLMFIDMSTNEKDIYMSILIGQCANTLHPA